MKHRIELVSDEKVITNAGLPFIAESYVFVAKKGKS